MISSTDYRPTNIIQRFRLALTHWLLDLAELTDPIPTSFWTNAKAGN